MHQTVFELKLGSTPVIAVNEKESTLKAFSILDETGRSGIAVVDEHGVITGNTSASDLRVLFYFILFYFYFYFYFYFISQKFFFLIENNRSMNKIK